MKKALVLTAVLLAGSFYLSCEKDDICAEDTPTTPSVVVEFYNKDNATVLRTVDDLAIIAINETDTLPLNDTGTLVGTVSRVPLPLRTNQDVTEYRLIYRSRATDGTRNEDLLKLDYTRTETYVSRACGYKNNVYAHTPHTCYKYNYTRRRWYPLDCGKRHQHRKYQYRKRNRSSCQNLFLAYRFYW
ncbi:DUF6452 family protein [Flavobacterium sp. J372]|uniref:DUF6452 family protein n=1 Tax=Flavobacterium sp. J372 TaxID=2898436 RepID=UPI002150D9F6|nr:DUF6452 family protein [Flavobacterium sp. J372]MCR5863582.1 DUF6452 family protein [Flavobacterium sp. J372]